MDSEEILFLLDKTQGTEFPPHAKLGEYFIRTNFWGGPRLFQRGGEMSWPLYKGYGRACWTKVPKSMSGYTLEEIREYVERKNCNGQ